MEKEKEGVVPNIYFLCRCLSVTESVDGFYCACRRKLPFAAQGKGKKTVVYRISVICGKSIITLTVTDPFCRAILIHFLLNTGMVVLCFGKSSWRTFLENWASFI